MSILVKGLALLKLGIDMAEGDPTWHHPDEHRSKESIRAGNKQANTEALATFKENWSKGEGSWDEASQRAAIRQAEVRKQKRNKKLNELLERMK